MRSMWPKFALIVVVLLVAGCAIGYNSALFLTRSNVGIDIESTPPTAEISVSRQEGVITPVFEGGKTPPFLAGFATGSEGLLRIPFGGRSVFAGGGAAVELSRKQGSAEAGNATDKCGVLCLSREPENNPRFGIDISIPGPGKVRPMFLGTDTTFGAKIAWSGASSTIPDSLVVGYNRKEIALAPVFGSAQVDCELPGGKTQKGNYGVWLPSFLAVLDSRLGVGSPSDSNFSYCQIIATGESATNLGKNDELRKMLIDIATGTAKKTESDNATKSTRTPARASMPTE